MSTKSSGDIHQYSRSVVADDVVNDPAAERKLVRKLDLIILPMMFMFYMLSYLDRVNIGNARIQGMNEELKLQEDNRYNTAALLFYPLYIVFEIPSNMLLKYLRPSLYLPGLMFAWGILTMCMGFVHSYQALYALRILLGLSEAGLVPGIVYVTSMYYRRHEYQKRLSFVFAAVPLAGAFGGLLAYGIAHLSGRYGYAGWRWIFIIEGAFTAFIAALAPLIVVDWPEQCRFLNQEERALLRSRLREDGTDFKMDKLNSFAVRRLLMDWKMYLGSLIYMGFTVTGLGMSFFLPTVLNDFGWEATEAQVYTIPVYMFALVLILVIAWLSDRYKHRYAFIMLCLAIATAGYGIALGQETLSRGVKYLGCFLIAGGALCASPLCLVFLSNNEAGHLKKAVSSAVQVSFGGIAGIIGSSIFLTREEPLYKTGYSTGLALLWVAGLAATVMALAMWVENRKRDRGERDERLSFPGEDVSNMGDYHPQFRFVL